MKLPFLGRRNVGTATAVSEGGAEDRHSRAFDAAVEFLLTRERRRVLDFGAAAGENVAFFSEVGCKLEILDLYPQLVERPDRLARTHEPFAIEHLIRSILEARPGHDENGPGDTFDLLLTWDLFDFLSPEQIRGLSEGIEPYTEVGTRLMAQVSFLGTVPTTPRSIKIQDHQTLRISSQPGQRPSPRYAEPQLLKVLPGWEVERCFLQRDGFREYLFVRR